jgi:hypothetical protein
MTFYLLFSVYERGDSVALAVQSGTVQFPASPAPFSTGLRDLVIRMLNLDWSFRYELPGYRTLPQILKSNVVIVWKVIPAGKRLRMLS